MNRNSKSDLGPWLSAGMALAPLGALIWAVTATAGIGFA
jgi:hypothetical protein